MNESTDLGIFPPWQEILMVSGILLAICFLAGALGGSLAYFILRWLMP